MSSTTARTLFVGLDDTDRPETPGTNHLARRLARNLPPGFRCRWILRHQLLFDPRIPYTSHNSSACIVLETQHDAPRDELLDRWRREIRGWCPAGSDPGLCVTFAVPAEIARWGLRCQREVVAQAEARRLAERHSILLEDHGGTGDGVIGALAAVGLASSGEDGRVVQLADWDDELRGVQTLETILARGVELRVALQADGDLSLQISPPATGLIDLGKRLRPAFRGGRPVLFVEPAKTSAAPWRAVRLP